MIAPASIAAGYGSHLATGSESADHGPASTTLRGTTGRVRSSAGAERAASLFFVSGTQVNFLTPARGPGRLRSRSPAGVRGLGGHAPGRRGRAGVFTANNNGHGVPAALVLRVRANGSQSYEPLLQRNAANTELVPLPIDLGPETDQVFLILSATDQVRSALSAVTLAVGGTNAEVGFAWDPGEFAGLDQGQRAAAAEPGGARQRRRRPDGRWPGGQHRDSQRSIGYMARL